ncbi:uncharacterized protein LOC143177113 [Calliopsis andreniformis]|uniref:uncharacterized protein LOC143177113 n=1 Tax=Calliopsis andreniformis TaxID=337506 RepID=UPI003FCEDE16
MKQVDHKSKYPPHSFSETRDSSDSYWKYPQKKSQSFPGGRSSRNPETVTSYYSCSTSYKPTKSYVCPDSIYSKYTSSHDPDPSHCNPQSHSKSGKDKYYLSNYSIARKNRYDEDLGDNEKLKYIKEELENFTEDNGEADAEEEVTEDGNETDEFLNKDYEEQITDDEREEECDTSQQTHRAQRIGKKEALLRQQQWRAVEEQNLRRLHCKQRAALGQGHSSPSRYCHKIADHDDHEPLSEDDFVPTSLKNSTKRPTSDYQQWSHSRNESDRYDSVSPPVQTPRRARTKPEIDQVIEPEFYKIRKCNRCGSVSSKKSELPTKGSCRFDDRGGIPTKGPIGDEPDSYEQAYYGRCLLRHSAKDTNEIPNSMYSMKARRPRDVKSPTIYEVPEQGQADKFSSDYPRSSARHHRRAVDTFPEKMKCTVHTSYSPSRMSPRYVE